MKIPIHQKQTVFKRKRTRDASKKENINRRRMPDPINVDYSTKFRQQLKRPKHTRICMNSSAGLSETEKLQSETHPIFVNQSTKIRRTQKWTMFNFCGVLHKNWKCWWQASSNFCGVLHESQTTNNDTLHIFSHFENCCICFFLFAQRNILARFGMSPEIG